MNIQYKTTTVRVLLPPKSDIGTFRISDVEREIRLADACYNGIDFEIEIDYKKRLHLFF